MNKNWIKDDDKFEVLTEVLRRTLVGGVIRDSDVRKEKEEIYQQAVDENIITEEKLHICDSCEKYYSISQLPKTCRCGEEIPDSPGSNVVQYYSDSSPEVINSLLGGYIGEFEIIYENCDIDDISFRDLEAVPSEDQYLHISPFFEFESQIYMFPNTNDIFLDWKSLEELIGDREDLMEEINDFLKRLDDGRRLVTEEGCEMFFGGPKGPDSGTTMDSSWYTKLHRTSKKSANKQSKARFGRNYNQQFERLGNEFLHLLFPHAVTLQAGGDNQPDGYLILKDRCYLVESKCYSNDLKIFKEQDKANRYVRKFVQNVDDDYSSNFNLTGYIFIAHKFNHTDFDRDLRTFAESNISYSNLDMVCFNDKMMASTVRSLSELYRKEPSAAHRICDKTGHYSSLVSRMSDITGPESLSEERYETVLDVIENLGEGPSNLEKRIAKGLDRETTFDKKLAEAL